MKIEQNNIIGVLIVIAIVAGVVAYNAGVSAGKADEQANHQYSDSDFTGMKACYEAVQNQVSEVNQATEYLGGAGDGTETYATLQAAVDEVQADVQGTIAGAPNPSGGNYDCP